MADLEYPVVVAPLSEEEGGGYVAFAVDLNGCMGDGQTPEEALADVRLAIVEWCNEAKRLSREMPCPGDAAKRAAEDRTEMRAVIEAQDSLIQKMDKLIAAQRTEVEKARQAARPLLEEEVGDEAVTIWGFGEMPGHIALQGSRRGRRRLVS